MSNPVCFCNDCERSTEKRRSYYIPSIERHTTQFQEYVRNMYRNSHNEGNSNILSNHCNNELPNTTIDATLSNTCEVNKEGETNVHSSLEWIKDMKSTERRPNENYIDENGSEQHYSILMAKLHSELLHPKRKSLKKKTIELWKRYAGNFSLFNSSRVIKKKYSFKHL